MNFDSLKLTIPASLIQRRCENCICQDECDVKNFLDGCDYFNKKPLKRGSPEYLACCYSCLNFIKDYQEGK